LTLGPEYFAHLYEAGDDPWRLATRWYEKRKSSISGSRSTFGRHLTRVRLLSRPAWREAVAPVRRLLHQLDRRRRPRAQRAGIACCLAGLASAAAATPVAVEVLVVLDSCTDASTIVAGSVPTLTVNERNVGAARRSGCRRLLRSRPPGVLDSQTWLATTDADTVVPPNWLTGMLKHAALGWDAVVGTVRVGDWDGHSAQRRAACRAGYDSRDGHRHVHGANLGFRGDAYRIAGGVPPIALSEDEQLIAALEGAGRRVLRTGELPVVTSGRRRGKVHGGFASFLLRECQGDRTS
jgi:hypothetical protein